MGNLQLFFFFQTIVSIFKIRFLLGTDSGSVFSFDPYWSPDYVDAVPSNVNDRARLYNFFYGFTTIGSHNFELVRIFFIVPFTNVVRFNT